jgi:hypothetical protein
VPTALGGEAVEYKHPSLVNRDDGEHPVLLRTSMDGEKPCRFFPKHRGAEETPDLGVGEVESNTVQVEGVENGAICRLKAAWGVRPAEEGMQSGSHAVETGASEATTGVGQGIEVVHLERVAVGARRARWKLASEAIPDDPDRLIIHMQLWQE